MGNSSRKFGLVASLLVAGLALGGCGTLGADPAGPAGPWDGTLPLPVATDEASQTGATDYVPEFTDPEMVAEWDAAAAVFEAAKAKALNLATQTWTPAEEVTINLDQASGIVQITAPGTYRLTGTLNPAGSTEHFAEPGQVVVDVPGGFVRLVLDNASVISNYHVGSALKIVNADIVHLMVEPGTENLLKSRWLPDDAPTDAEATLYSNADLVISGSGALAALASIGSNAQIVVNGGFTFVGANSAADESGSLDCGGAIKARDYLVQFGGTISLLASSAGLVADGPDGRVGILGGHTDLSLGDTAIHATRSILVAGGESALYPDGTTASLYAVSWNDETVIETPGYYFQSAGAVVADGGVIAGQGLVIDGGSLLAVSREGQISAPVAASSQGWAMFQPSSRPAVPENGEALKVNANGSEVASIWVTNPFGLMLCAGPEFTGSGNYSVLLGGQKIGSLTYRETPSDFVPPVVGGRPGLSNLNPRN